MDAIRQITNDTRIGEGLAGMKQRPLPLVAEDASVDEVVRAMLEAPHSRLLYVVDSDGKLVGSISLGGLVRHVFPELHEPTIHARSLLDVLTNETAQHIMQSKPMRATKDETVADVLSRLVRADVKEFLVVDSDGRATADLTIVDLLAYFMESGKEPKHSSGDGPHPGRK